MTKKDQLTNLNEVMEGDTSLPLRKGATRLVFGVGATDADILCIGEGPGYWEDQKGEPFVGNAGKLLDQLLVSIGLDRTKVYITNIVHHRPPGNRDPLPEEISAYGAYLDKIIAILEPKVILTLGRYSMAKFLPNARISSVHGKSFGVTWQGRAITVVPMYHPAAALRNGEVMYQEKQDFLKLPEILKNSTRIESDSKEKDVEQMTLV